MTAKSITERERERSGERKKDRLPERQTDM